MNLSSKRVYDVWTQLVQDEELYEAMLRGSHGERGLDPEAVAILDWFRREPGTVWNVENLRFRSALEIGDTLLVYMPRTIRLLTHGIDEWRQDLCFEYLAHHHWQSLGASRLVECQRFIAFIRTRVMRRRITPPHLEAVIAFEAALVDLFRATAGVPPESWPVRRERSAAELAEARPRRSPVQALVELAVDLRPWIESGDPTRGEPGPGPLTLLLHIPSLEEPYKIKAISDGVRVVLERCDGERTTAALASELEDEFGLPSAEVHKLVRALLDERILRA